MTIDTPSDTQSLSQNIHTLTFQTQGVGFIDITDDVAEWISKFGAQTGLLTAFVQHTSASLVIQENADPDVTRDLIDTLNRLAPESKTYRHSCEGPDDMPAHIKSMVTNTSLGIPVNHGRMVLGTWQGLYLVEHRTAPHRRHVVLQYTGTVR